MLKNLIAEGDSDDKSEIEVALALDRAAKEGALRLLEVMEDIEGGVVFTEAESERIKYDDPLVKELRATEVNYIFSIMLQFFIKEVSFVISRRICS